MEPKKRTVDERCSAPGVMCSGGGSEKWSPAVLTMWLSWVVPLAVAKSRSAVRFVSSPPRSERSQARPERCIGCVEEEGSVLQRRSIAASSWREPEMRGTQPNSRQASAMA
jgi:hypothetical protein